MATKKPLPDITMAATGSARWSGRSHWGENLSGTGPKAGGPYYLLRFATERTLTINTTAAGGNASLLTLGE